jgi:hypothetical protein
MTICGTLSQAGIATAAKDGIVAGYKNTIPQPTSVTAVQDGPDSWTVSATWPPCAAGTTTSHSADNEADED